MRRALLVISAAAIIMSGGCRCNEDKSGESEQTTQRKKNKPARGNANADAAFGGRFRADEVFKRVTRDDHGGAEPGSFSAEWVAREAHLVAERAAEKKYDKKTSAFQASRCTLFLDGGTVRRLVVFREDVSQEYAMNARGEVILWYEATREKPPESEAWAFYHQGTMQLFQERAGGSELVESEPPHETPMLIASIQKECIDNAGLQPAPPKPTTMPFDLVVGDSYEIVAKHSGHCLEVEGKHRGYGVRVTQGPCKAERHQLFEIAPHDGAYRIKVLHTGQCMTVFGASNDDGAQIVQAKCGTEAAGDTVGHQLFHLSRQDDGHYTIVNKLSDQAIDVAAASKVVGAMVHQWPVKQVDNQRFSFRARQAPGPKPRARPIPGPRCAPPEASTVCKCADGRDGLTMCVPATGWTPCRCDAW